MTRGEGEERGGDGACCHGRGTDGVDVAAAAASWASTTRLMQPVAAMCHGFEVRAEDVEVLDTPASFYDTLVREARAASRRVVLGSLYVGTGDREATLVSVIADRLRSVPELGVRVMVDHSRGLRRVRGAVEGGQTSGSGGGGVGGGGGGGDVAAEARSSQHVLAPLLEACNAAPDHGTSHHERVQVGYLQMPQLQVRVCACVCVCVCVCVPVLSVLVSVLSVLSLLSVLNLGVLWKPGNPSFGWKGRVAMFNLPTHLSSRCCLCCCVDELAFTAGQVESQAPCSVQRGHRGVTHQGVCV